MRVTSRERLFYQTLRVARNIPTLHRQGSFASQTESYVTCVYLASLDSCHVSRFAWGVRHPASRVGRPVGSLPLTGQVGAHRDVKIQPVNDATSSKLKALEMLTRWMKVEK